VIARALEEGVIVQPEPAAEEAWFQTVGATVGAYATYFATCTPGYLNNELQAPEERDSRSAVYMHSAVEFKDLLAAWRAEGTMPGLVLTPIHDPVVR
jgi:cyclohexanone monooxygenase